MSLNIIKCTSAQFEDLTPEVGQVVFVQDSDSDQPSHLLMWSGTEWTEIKDAEGSSEITMTAYEMNQQLIHQLPELDHNIIPQKKELIYNFCNETANNYYMLLCRDTNYYTVLHRIHADASLDFIADVVTECAETQGAIKSIELTEDKSAIEIWVDNPCFEDCTYVMYFFPYDGGIEVCQ